MLFDSLEFFVYLAAPCYGLTPAGIQALLKLRQTQLAARAGAKGAFVSVKVVNERLDLRNAGRGTPLIGDFHSLICLQLIESFPARAAELRALLAARRAGLDLDALVDGLWESSGSQTLDAAVSQYNISRPLLSATLLAAVKPLHERTAEVYLHHFDPAIVGRECPVCAGAPYARQGQEWLCSICETAWPATRACAGCGGENWHEAAGIQPEGARRLYCGDCGRSLAEYEAGESFNEVYDLGPPVSLIRQLE